MARHAAYASISSREIALLDTSGSARGKTTARSAYGALTATRSQTGGLRLGCQRSADGRAARLRQKPPGYPDIPARAGCVWCVTVKDPKKCPTKRYRSPMLHRLRGVTKPSRRSRFVSSICRFIDVEKSDSADSRPEPRTSADER